MLVSIKLQQNLPCDYICHMIQKALAQYQKDNDVSDSVLVIDIKKVNDNIDSIPKIEFKDSLS